MHKFPLLFMLVIITGLSCKKSIDNQAQELAANFMDAYKIPLNRGEMSKLYKNLTFRNIYSVQDYQIKNFKRVSDTELHANIETTVKDESNQLSTKLLRLVLTKKDEAWTITDSKGIANLIKNYSKEFGFGIRAGCFTKNIETLTDQQFLGKINRSIALLTQLAQKESGTIASKLSSNLNWKVGSDKLSGDFINKSDYSFKEVGYLVKYYNGDKRELGMHNSILTPLKQGTLFSNNQNTAFSNKLPQPIPKTTKNVDIQFFINPKEIMNHLSLKPLTGKECAGIK